MSFLEVRGVGLHYGAAVALDGVSLDVPRGSRLAVVGPSGSGKSTLLRVLAGFEAPQAGQVRLDGELIVDGPRILPAHRRAVGLVAQEGALFPHLSVADNIGFGLPRRGPFRRGGDCTARIRELAALVGLDDAMLRRGPDALSGGQQQRVALARALAPRPRLLLLDEPFSALDTALRAGTRQAVVALLASAGMTAVLVTHDREEALSFADQVAVLQEGRLLQAGPPRDLYLRPGGETVARLLGAAVVLPATLSPGWAECALGRLPVADDGADGGACGRAGEGRVMLRPEQITLHDAAPGVPAWVDGAEFGGELCLVRLRLAGGEAVTVRLPPTALRDPGTVVHLRITGPAHRLR